MLQAWSPCWKVVREDPRTGLLYSPDAPTEATVAYVVGHETRPLYMCGPLFAFASKRAAKAYADQWPDARVYAAAAAGLRRPPRTCAGWGIRDVVHGEYVLRGTRVADAVMLLARV